MQARTSQATRAQIVVDLDQIKANVRALAAHLGPLMVVVKADAYGHGMVPVARALRADGVEWLGVATLDEAMVLRQGGDHGRLLAWLAVPGEDYRPAVNAEVDVAAASINQLEEIAAAARAVGLRARVHLKVDTGLSRGGAPLDEWDDLVAHAAGVQDVDVVGVWSHLASGDEPQRESNDLQEDAFRRAVKAAEGAGLPIEVRHLASSAAAITRPSARFDLVRVGIAAYGLSPVPDLIPEKEIGIAPAMTVSGQIALGKNLSAGDAVSYGGTFVAEAPMRVGLVPLGYGDGIPRHASSRAEVQVNGRRAPVLGRICMDQFVVAAPDVEAGDDVIILGTGEGGEPTAHDWARWSDTIVYEIVTRMGGRQERRWIGG